MKRLTTFYAVATVFLICGCNKKQQEPVSPERLKALETELAQLKAAQTQASPQDKRKGELTRQLATELLNDFLVKPSISQLEFQDDGLTRAQQQGLVSEQGGFPPSYRFTDKGIAMVKDVIRQNRIELAPFGAQSPKFTLANPLAERVSEVTGIASTPFGVTSVEYTTRYIVPIEMEPLFDYIFTGRKAQAGFRMYDDGWRVVEQ